MRGSLVVLFSSIVALVTVGLVGVTWNQRADDICREQAPGTASDYSVNWKLDEFAYVCDYSAPGERSRRVGIVDAFHSGGKQRHRP